MSLYLGDGIARLVSRPATGWTAGGSITGISETFFLYSAGFRPVLGREGDHSPSSSAEIKNGGATPPILHTSSWHSD
jgi:hypothetical protein